MESPVPPNAPPFQAPHLPAGTSSDFVYSGGYQERRDDCSTSTCTDQIIAGCTDQPIDVPIGPLANTQPRRSMIGAISKDSVPSFSNSTGRSGSQQMVLNRGHHFGYQLDKNEQRDSPPFSGSSSEPLQKLAFEGSRIGKQIQSSQIIENINKNLRSTRVADAMNETLRSFSVNRDVSDKGIFSSRNNAWGTLHNRGLEIMASLERKHRPGLGRSISLIGKKNEVSFDYQLFQDME